MSGGRATEAPETGPVLDPEIEALGFDAALAELQRTVAALEAGGQPLEEAIALYARGVALHERCGRLLTEAELRVRTLGERAAGAIRPIPESEPEGDGGER